jgi:hypothetical protein
MRTAPSVTNAKLITECSDKELKKVMTIARLNANKMGRDHLADDFASYVLEDLVKQGHLRYNLGWLWATFLRGTLGNLRNEKGKAKATGRSRAVALEKALHVEDTKPLPSDPDPFGNVYKEFRGKDRAVLVLKFKWGFTDQEIGDALGVSCQRVNQMYQAICETIQVRRLILPTARRSHDN